MNIDVKRLINILREAGDIVLDIYNGDFSVEYKEDHSPVTIADKKSNRFITDALGDLYPDIPVLAEEARALPYSIRKTWEYLWVLDPLDGTKEFIKKNGEFTINLALVYRGSPVFGIIYAPVIDTVYYGEKGSGAYKLEGDKLSRLSGESTKKGFSVIISRSHYTEETREYVRKLEERYKEVEKVNIGSALKLCLIAEGKADLYPRLAPTMEWDVAAGHAIISATGGDVVEYISGRPLIYNKENLVNPWFIAKRRGVTL